MPKRTFEAQRMVRVCEPALWTEGVLQNREGVVHVKADRIRVVPGQEVTPRMASYDFH